jgi:acetyltransferase-like isoleucine patch superfamily enzyme
MELCRTNSTTLTSKNRNSPRRASPRNCWHYFCGNGPGLGFAAGLPNHLIPGAYLSCARLYGRPFVHPAARIEIPWNLTMHDRACLGDRAHAYSLGEIVLKQRCTIAQESYLCTGTHDFTHPVLPLQTAPIVIEEDAFLGARSFIMPGITIGAGAVIGACSVVTGQFVLGILANR